MFHIYLQESLFNVVDWIQLVCAVFMAVCAGIALNMWKRQKKFEILTEAKSNIHSCINLFEKVTDLADILHKWMPEDETAAYQFEYKVFFRSDFLNAVNPNLISNVVEAYNEFKKNSVNDVNVIFYNASKVLTYKNNSCYLINEFEETKKFYTSLLSELQSFEASISMLQTVILKETYAPDDSDNDIEFAKGIIEKLFDYKIEVVNRLTQTGYSLLLKAPSKTVH